jgi:benzoyl-CoA reductase subunit C
MYMVVASQIMDKREHSEELKKILPQLPNRKTERPTGTRLLMVGSETDDVEFIKMLESTNSTIVIDDHCTGSRYFWNRMASPAIASSSISPSPWGSSRFALKPLPRC